MTGSWVILQGLEASTSL